MNDNFTEIIFNRQSHGILLTHRAIVSEELYGYLRDDRVELSLGWTDKLVSLFRNGYVNKSSDYPCLPSPLSMYGTITVRSV